MMMKDSVLMRGLSRFIYIFFNACIAFAAVAFPSATAFFSAATLAVSALIASL